jgi:hypothetical protein
MSYRCAWTKDLDMIDPYRTIPPIVALTGFAVSIVAGLSVGNPGTSVVLRALVAMVMCLIVGELLAMVVRAIAKQEGKAYAAKKPIPPLMSLATTASGEVVEAPSQATGSNVNNKKKL